MSQHAIYNPEFLARQKLKRAEDERRRAREALDPALKLIRNAIPAEDAPQLAASTLIRRAFEDGVVDVLFDAETIDRLVPGRSLYGIVMLECAIVHLIGHWAGDDGTYGGTPLELARLARRGSGSSFVQICIGTLVLRGFLQRGPGMRWKLSDDGVKLRAELSGHDLWGRE
jgi:hypothetical protein